MMDLTASLVLFVSFALAAMAWWASGRSRRAERVEQGGSSVFLPAAAQHVGYLAMAPLGRALARMGISANAITLASIPLAAAAAVAFAYGHYGLGALGAALAFTCDMLDGLVARTTGTASDAGEVLDAAADRVCEALLFGGLAFAYRERPVLLGLVLFAGLAAQQVTHASAKVEVYALKSVPRGTMRRAERAVYFVVGAALCGLVGHIAPMLVALVVIGVAGNVSATRRYVALARALRERDAHAAE